MENGLKKVAANRSSSASVCKKTRSSEQKKKIAKRLEILDMLMDVFMRVMSFLMVAFVIFLTVYLFIRMDRTTVAGEETKKESISIELVDGKPEVINNDKVILEVQPVKDEYIKATDEIEERQKVIDSKSDRFVMEKVVNPDDVMVVTPLYNKGKIYISSREEALCIDIRTESNWTKEDFYSVLNKEMYGLVDTAIALEDEAGINALYIIAVGANETGWGKHMAADNNYFNWTNDGINHFDFESAEEFRNFSIYTYSKYYKDESFYSEKLGFVPEYITLEVVNTKYALFLDGTTNWQWSNTISDIMSGLCRKLNYN